MVPKRAENIVPFSEIYAIEFLCTLYFQMLRYVYAYASISGISRLILNALEILWSPRFGLVTERIHYLDAYARFHPACIFLLISFHTPYVP